MPDQIHTGDIGAILEIEVQVNEATIDISSYTTIEIKLLKPDGVTVKTFTASFTTDGTDGKMRYVTTAASDLDVAGNWKMQGRLAKVGEDFRTEETILPIVDPI